MQGVLKKSISNSEGQDTAMSLICLWPVFFAIDLLREIIKLYLE